MCCGNACSPRNAQKRHAGARQYHEFLMASPPKKILGTFMFLCVPNHMVQHFGAVHFPEEDRTFGLVHIRVLPENCAQKVMNFPATHRNRLPVCRGVACHYFLTTPPCA